MNVIKVKVKPNRIKKADLELTLSPLVHNTWLEAIVEDDKETVEAVLSSMSCDEERGLFLK